MIDRRERLAVFASRVKGFVDLLLTEDRPAATGAKPDLDS
jgi:hypothetical protein